MTGFNSTLDFMGIYVPSLLLPVLLAAALTWGITRLLARFDLYRFVWHRALFNLALFAVVFGTLSAPILPW